MSEKRHRQQQRRQRRKAAGRSRSAPSEHSAGATSRAQAAGEAAADRELAKLMAGMAAIAVREAHEPSTALEAEQWASYLIGLWHVRPLLDGDVEELFFPVFVKALEQIGTAAALTTLRALSAIGARVHGRRARAAADRLAARGLREPPWLDALGQSRPTVAALMHDPAFDDGVSVIVEFATPASEPHTIGIYIDHNVGVLVKDVFLAGPLSEVRATLGRNGCHEAGLTISELGLAEARARVEAALEMLDHTYDPPVNADVRTLRALIDARMQLLPAGFRLSGDLEDLTPQERDALLADFLGAPEGKRWRGDDEAEDVIATAIDFGADYNHGGPLRWSPVVVEIYMTSWLARKVAREPEFFARVPDTLCDWVAYAGRRRGVPPEQVCEAVDAVQHHRAEMLDAAGDPEAWGPAKTFAIAAQRSGVDLADPDAVERFVEQYNDGLAA